MSRNGENDSEATQYFMVQASQEWEKEFGSKKSRQPFDHEKTIRQLTLNLAKAETEIADKQKLVELSQNEAKQLSDREKELSEKYEEALKEIEKLKSENIRLKASENNSICERKDTEKLPVEESVVYRHMIDNPFQQAVKEHEERENIKRRRLETTCDYDPIKIQEHLDEIKKLKHEIDTLNIKHERARAFQTEFARRYRECVRNITGYDIKMRTEEFFEVTNIYDLGNHFEFQRDGNEINLLDTEYAKMWPEFMEKYLREYDSLACFMSAVTIDLRALQLQLPSTITLQLPSSDTF